MQIPLQIGFHNLAPSEPLSQLIQQKVDKLEQHFPRLIGCKVSVEQPNHHHRKGKGSHYRVSVELLVPGETLVASREGPEISSHEEAHQAISKTFAAALRQLETFTRQLDGRVKPHGAPKLRDRPWLKD